MLADLVQDALVDIWSVPDATNQVILRPGRITPNGGVVKSYSVLFDTYILPNQTSTWHLYQIGQVHPTLINLFAVFQEWELLADACNRVQMVANLYTANGIELPRTRSYYYVTDTKNVVIAVEKNANIAMDFDNDAVYLRTFRNAYFQLPEYAGVATLEVAGGLVTSIADVVTYQSAVNAIRDGANYTGGLYTFVNGKKTASITLQNAGVGDVVEYVYDSSIYKVADFTLSSLRSFTSILDSKPKYLLHYASGWDGQIDFCDNIDMYLIDATTQVGVYVHKNAADTLRMVTFKDYSVVSSYLAAYFSQFAVNGGSVNTSNLVLRLHIRYDGWSQVPADNANRMHYLLKLADADQVEAMVGTSGTVNAWKAANLEQCAYVSLMRAKRAAVTQTLAESAYGYSVVNRKYAQNTQPTVTTSGSPVASVPRAMQYGCTAYEYDANGYLSGFYSVASGIVDYICVDAATTLVEFIHGSGGVTLDEVLREAPTTTLAAGVNYRYYMAPVTNGVVGAWQDVTGTNAYTVTNGVSAWVATGNDRRIVRSDRQHLAYQVTLTPSDGILTHNLVYTQAGAAGVRLAVPLGELDVWLNGRSLVPGVDYFYTHPTITVCSKEVLVNAPGAQVLTVRMTGFCKSDLSSQKVEETGFVYDGVLSVDEIYALHYYKSQRIVVNGQLLANDAPAFIEDLLTGPSTNGKPYAVREMLNPLNNFIAQEPYAYYGLDRATDVAVSAYLTLKLPEALAGLNPITRKYVLYSPFICKVLFALVSGNLVGPTVSYADSVVVDLVAPYTYLLAGDPITTGNTPDTRYCVIEPHWLDTSIGLSQTNYRFLANVVRLYANNLVVLSELVHIAT